MQARPGAAATTQGRQKAGPSEGRGPFRNRRRGRCRCRCRSRRCRCRCRGRRRWRGHSRSCCRVVGRFLLWGIDWSGYRRVDTGMNMLHVRRVVVHRQVRLGPVTSLLCDARECTARRGRRESLCRGGTSGWAMAFPLRPQVSNGGPTICGVAGVKAFPTPGTKLLLGDSGSIRCYLEKCRTTLYHRHQRCSRL